jgi:hypothetical protein
MSAFSFSSCHPINTLTGDRAASFEQPGSFFELAKEAMERR